MVNKINRDFIEPEVLTSLARKALADYEVNSPDSLAKYLPSQEVPDIEYEIEKGQEGLITAANWRMFGGNTTSETWGQGESARGRLMPLSRNFILDEETLLRQRNDKGDAIGREAAKLVERATKAIALQVNYQRGNALANGQVEIKGSGGLEQIVDFGRKEEFTTTAPKLFTDPDADPISYLVDIAEAYEDENGFRPEKMLLPLKVRQALFTHPKVVLAATRNELAPRASDAEISRLLSDYDLPQVEKIGHGKVKVDNLKTGETEIKSILPQDSILFVPGAGDPRDPESSEYGRTLWGQTISADLPEFNLAGQGLDLPGIVAAVLFEGWPASKEVIADAIAMPVVYSPNYTLKSKVIELGDGA